MSSDIPAVVLDTSVVSIIYRSDPRSSYYEEQIKGRGAVISFQTLEELLFGAYKAGWGERRASELKLHIAQGGRRSCGHLRATAPRTRERGTEVGNRGRMDSRHRYHARMSVGNERRRLRLHPQSGNHKMVAGFRRPTEPANLARTSERTTLCRKKPSTK